MNANNVIDFPYKKPNVLIVRSLLKSLKYIPGEDVMEATTHNNTKIKLNCKDSITEIWDMVFEVVKKESPNPNLYQDCPKPSLIQGTFRF